MSDKFELFVQAIPQLVGGEENVEFFTHCVTRLRFTIIDKGKVNSQAIEQYEGIIGTAWSGNQLQIIIGQEVGDVYRSILDRHSFSSHREEKKRRLNLSQIADVISSCLTPLIPLLIGTGMLKVVSLLLTLSGLLSPENPTYVAIQFIGDAGYYFLPVFVGATAAQRFKTNTGLGMLLGALLIHPTLIGSAMSGEALSLFSIQIPPVNYSSTIFPTLLAVFVLSYVEKIVEKISPTSVRSLLVPFISILVMAPLTLLLIAPIGYYLGDYFAAAILWIYETTGFLGIALLASLSPFVIMSGMHTAFVPYMVQSLATLGYEPILSVSMFIYNFNQGAASLAVALKSKRSERKSVALAAGITAFAAGVTEPALFGVNMKYKTPLLASMIGSFVGAALAGILKVRVFAFAGSGGVFGLPAFIGEPTSNFLFMVFSALVGIVVTFVLAFILYKEAANVTNKGSDSEIELLAPTSGQVIAMSDIPDPVFSSGALGSGLGILPTEDIVVSPIVGEVVMVSESKHAIGLKTDDGMEMLLHIGIDTVQLNGEGFDVLVQVGSRVEKGQALLVFDRQKVEEQGYSTIVICVVTSLAADKKINWTDDEKVQRQDLIGRVVKDDKETDIPN